MIECLPYSEVPKHGETPALPDNQGVRNGQD